MPTLYEAHLEYLDRRDVLDEQEKAATTDGERQHIAGLKASLVEDVAGEYREMQQLFTSKDREHMAANKKLPPDKQMQTKRDVPGGRLVTVTSLKLAIKKGHNAYREWLKAEGLQYPE